jgi:hypothetical protein
VKGDIMSSTITPNGTDVHFWAAAMTIPDIRETVNWLEEKYPLQSWRRH